MVFMNTLVHKTPLPWTITEKKKWSFIAPNFALLIIYDFFNGIFLKTWKIYYCLCFLMSARPAPLFHSKLRSAREKNSITKIFIYFVRNKLYTSLVCEKNIKKLFLNQSILWGPKEIPSHHLLRQNIQNLKILVSFSSYNVQCIAIE